MDLVTNLVSHSSPFLILALWIALASAVLWWQAAGSRWWLLWLCVPVVLLVTLSTPLAAFLALGTLEWRHHAWLGRPTPCPVIVVLGGGMLLPDAVRHEAKLTADTMHRCCHAAALYHQAEPCPILVSGGRVQADQPGPPLAEVMAGFLRRLGVAEEHLWLESESRDTYENAVRCRKQLAARGIDRGVLVTSAVHMVRAERCFRRQGLIMTPSGCAYRATTFTWEIDQFLPSPSAASDVQDAYHEWIGLLWYYLSGRI